MSYTKRNLLPNEVIKYKASLHWIIYIPTILCIVLGYILEEAGYSWICILAAIYFFLGALLRKLGSEFVLTNKRIVLRQGIISRETVEIILAKCEDVSVEQSVMGRILGYGSLIVTTGGATSYFDYVKTPVVFRNKVSAEIDAFYRRYN